MRYFVISDIHGDYEVLEKLMRFHNPDKERLIFIGDICSKGKYSYECMAVVKELVEKFNAILIKGNHEFMFIQFLINPKKAIAYVDSYANGIPTLESFGSELLRRGYTEESLNSIEKLTSAIKKEFNNFLHFFQEAPLYFTSKRYVFSHAGISPTVASLEELTNDYDAMMWGGESTYKQAHILDKISVFGHMPTQNMAGSIGGLPHYIKEFKKLAIDGGGFIREPESNPSINAVILSDDSRAKKAKYISINTLNHKVTKGLIDL